MRKYLTVEIVYQCGKPADGLILPEEIMRQIREALALEEQRGTVEDIRLIGDKAGRS